MFTHITRSSYSCPLSPNILYNYAAAPNYQTAENKPEPDAHACANQSLGEGMISFAIDTTVILSQFATNCCMYETSAESLKLVQYGSPNQALNTWLYTDIMCECGFVGFVTPDSTGARVVDVFNETNVAGSADACYNTWFRSVEADYNATISYNSDTGTV